jgi:hypothetical protein
MSRPRRTSLPWDKGGQGLAVGWGEVERAPKRRGLGPLRADLLVRRLAQLGPSNSVACCYAGFGALRLAGRLMASVLALDGR